MSLRPVMALWVWLSAIKNILSALLSACYVSSWTASSENIPGGEQPRLISRARTNRLRLHWTSIRLPKRSIAYYEFKHSLTRQEAFLYVSRVSFRRLHLLVRHRLPALRAWLLPSGLKFARSCNRQPALWSFVRLRNVSSTLESCIICEGFEEYSCHGCCSQVQTLDQVLERGQKLDDLVDKSADLSAQSKMFYKQAKKTNSCCVIS